MKVGIDSTKLTDFDCPQDVLKGSKEVLEGLYHTPEYTPSTPPRILDIGGNVGAYTIWAAAMYPGCRISVYEPHPKNMEYLLKNTAHIPELVVENCAVLGGYNYWTKWFLGENTVFLRTGVHNCGEHSIFDVGEQGEEGVDVPFKCAASLPPCEVLKMDTEGAEPGILFDYKYLRGVQQVCYEWHRCVDKYEIGAFLCKKGFRLVKEVNYTAYKGARGVAVWVR